MRSWTVPGAAPAGARDLPSAAAHVPDPVARGGDGAGGGAGPGRAPVDRVDPGLPELSGIASAGRETAGQLVRAGTELVQEPDGGCLLTWARLTVLPSDA